MLKSNKTWWTKHPAVVSNKEEAVMSAFLGVARLLHLLSFRDTYDSLLLLRETHTFAWYPLAKRLKALCLSVPSHSMSYISPYPKIVISWQIINSSWFSPQVGPHLACFMLQWCIGIKYDIIINRVSCNFILLQVLTAPRLWASFCLSSCLYWTDWRIELYGFWPNQVCFSKLLRYRSVVFGTIIILHCGPKIWTWVVDLMEIVSKHRVFFNNRSFPCKSSMLTSLYILNRQQPYSLLSRFLLCWISCQSCWFPMLIQQMVGTFF